MDSQSRDRSIPKSFWSTLLRLMTLRMTARPSNQLRANKLPLVSDANGARANKK